MEKRDPHSFIIFAIVVSVIILVFTAAVILSQNNVSTKYAVVLVFVLLLMFALSAVGIYAGARYDSEAKKLKRLNRIGFIGNTVLFVTMLGAMVVATLMR